MKIYSKLLEKIRKNKNRLTKLTGVITVGLGIRYGKTNLISTNLLSNDTQQIEQIYNENLQVTDLTNADVNLLDDLGHKSSITLFLIYIVLHNAVNCNKN